MPALSSQEEVGEDGAPLPPRDWLCAGPARGRREHQGAARGRAGGDGVEEASECEGGSERSECCWRLSRRHSAGRGVEGRALRVGRRWRRPRPHAEARRSDPFVSCIGAGAAPLYVSGPEESDAPGARARVVVGVPVHSPRSGAQGRRAGAPPPRRDSQAPAPPGSTRAGSDPRPVWPSTRRLRGDRALVLTPPRTPRGRPVRIASEASRADTKAS